MEAALPLALLAMGLASGVHCLGMCGGIVTAFAARQPLLERSRIWKRQAAFNAGRISSYALAGLLAGATGLAFEGSLPLYLLVNVLLIFAGLHLAGVRTPMLRLEALGAPLWRKLQPIASSLMRSTSLSGSYTAGAVWGWIPCGLVYGALGAAALAGSPARGALAMAAFGAGTLPWLLAAGVAAARLRGWIRHRPVRAATGGLVVAYGAWGLAHSLLLGGHA
ncbi:MAG TPA: sulfite exporter TauE/SafE family protein [Burkholderiales bacterium]